MRYITKEDAICALEIISDKMSKSGQSVMKQAISIIDDLNEVDRWISVNDRLPKEEINPHTLDYKKVICLCKFNENKDVRVYKYGNNHFWNGAGIMDENVIAWQPLPEIPN